jgi:Mg2+/Co2+ transporter CorB
VSSLPQTAWHELATGRTLPAVDKLHQLFARSLREIEAHATDLAETETGRYFINEAAQLLAALRLWAQNHHRSDQVVREILETVDLVTLAEVAAELRETATADATAASGTIAELVRLPSGQLLAVASCALRAL